MSTADLPEAGLVEEIAPGVLGYTQEEAGELWIPVIIAANPGSGQVSAYLDSLPHDQTVCVPEVMSPKLAGMLLRRGFRQEKRFFAEVGCWGEVFVRRGG